MLPIYLLGKLHRDTIPNEFLMILTENVLHVFYTIFILILIMISDDCIDAHMTIWLYFRSNISFLSNFVLDI